jgi:hypothetical protein
MKNLKLNTMASDNLSKVEMNQLNGGEAQRVCGCGCAYRDNGGSSIKDNCSANYYGGSKGLNSEDTPILCEATPSEQDN